MPLPDSATKFSGRISQDLREVEPVSEVAVDGLHQFRHGAAEVAAGWLACVSVQSDCGTCPRPLSVAAWIARSACRWHTGCDNASSREGTACESAELSLPVPRHLPGLALRRGVLRLELADGDALRGRG